MPDFIPYTERPEFIPRHEHPTFEQAAALFAYGDVDGVLIDYLARLASHNDQHTPNAAATAQKAAVNE